MLLTIVLYHYRITETVGTLPFATALPFFGWPQKKIAGYGHLYCRSLPHRLKKFQRFPQTP